MGAGLPSNNVINLESLAEKFAEGDVVTLAAIEEKRIFNLSGRESRLGLKVLGEGELPFALTIRAERFSKSALAKIEAAGGKAEIIPVKAKWTRKAAKAAGKSK
jgi:large subunit ribosomal protein L15